MGEIRYRTYRLTDPDGRQHIVGDGLATFCKTRGLLRANLVLVATGVRKHHRGWKCEYADVEAGHADRKPS